MSPRENLRVATYLFKFGRLWENLGLREAWDGQSKTKQTLHINRWSRDRFSVDRNKFMNGFYKYRNWPSQNMQGWVYKWGELFGNLKVLQTCHLMDFTGASCDCRCPIRCIRKTSKIRQAAHHPKLKIILDSCREVLSKDQSVTLSARGSEV